MGNRGILHDEDGRVLRNHAHQNWVTCALDFRGRRQVIMAPRRYTQLFFPDEATAFAAGHRPCAECRRERYTSFRDAWLRVHGRPEASKPISQTIDRALHAARVNRAGVKFTFEAPLSDLPDGTIVEESGQPVLLWASRTYRWTFHGYRAIALAADSRVSVLTPKPGWKSFLSVGDLGSPSSPQCSCLSSKQIPSYKMRCSSRTGMVRRLVPNGTTEIRGSLGEISATDVSLATAIWLQTTMPLSAGDTVELEGYFRVADGYFAAGQVSFWGCKVG